jgi:hypothetical protein
VDILFVSPSGTGLSLADRLRSSNHRVAIYGKSPESVPKHELYPFMIHAGLSIVDGPFATEPTSHGSWRPSAEALFIEELRRARSAVALGSTPTVDLLTGDRRYFRKWCGRLSLPYAPSTPEGADPWFSGAWFRGRDVVPDGPYLRPWLPLFKSVRFRGWFALHGYIGETDPQPILTACSAEWPVETIPEGREMDFLTEMAR